MASRLTTNQEIAGSTPAVVIWIFFSLLFFPFFVRAQPFRLGSGHRRPYALFICALFRDENSEQRLLFILLSSSSSSSSSTSMRLTQIQRFPAQLLSTVQRGTAFEYRALALLTKHLSMSLTRVGGSYDGGIDLSGWWWVPMKKNNLTTRAYVFASRKSVPVSGQKKKKRAYTHTTPHFLFFSISDPLDATVAPMGGCTIANRRRLRVFAQCKAEKRKMGPACLRELEGVVHRYATAPVPAAATITTTGIRPNPDSLRVPETIGTVPNDDSNLTLTEPPPIALLVSESAFTRYCVLAAHASPLPFLLVHLPRISPHPSPPSSSSGGGSPIGSVYGNPALLSANGVLGGELEIRWERGGGGNGSGVPSSGITGSTGRPRLWWQGQPLPSWTPEAAGAGADVDVDVDVDGMVLN
jgi:Protein of unknown function (DUF2034)